MAEDSQVYRKLITDELQSWGFGITVCPAFLAKSQPGPGRQLRTPHQTDRKKTLKKAKKKSQVPA
jgi:hypothetical protein